ncbi:MAG: FAD-dependent oxidoreductase [Proteobacteria bacterium]|nr:FAD-dependent oxidoreductase [Pseudomonadota bacterium]MBU1715403.1 FAD-dependent oxidoreductase [Pseudomonadota bacterium]
MAEFEYDLGIIGGGAAGLTVAAGAAQLGAKTLLVEKEEQLGGDCLHYGCVPSKTLIKTATVYHQIRNSQRYGLPIIDLPIVDFKPVAARIKSVIDTIQRHDSVERFCKLGAKVEFGPAMFTDEHTIKVNGQKRTAKKWLIATGSSPATPPIAGLDQVSYLTNKELFYLDRLPASMIVIGAGPIAIEMAQAFNRLGTKVQVVQRSGQILSKEDKDLADITMQVLADEGIKFYLDTSLISASEKGALKKLAIKTKDGQTISLEAEELLIALGRTPNVEGLGLTEIGVEFDHKGIKVDNRLRTTQKHIYAAGDVNGAFQFTHAAGYEGGIVLSNAIFHLPRKVNYTLLPWCTYTDPELASIGINEKAADTTNIKYSLWTEEFKDNDRSLAEGEQVGRIKLLLNEKERPIGIQILGPHAGELLNEWVAVMNGKTRLSTLASSVHPYPTLGEINKRVAGAFLSRKLFSNKVRKALSFFFNLKGRACELD